MADEAPPPVADAPPEAQGVEPAAADGDELAAAAAEDQGPGTEPAAAADADPEPAGDGPPADAAADAAAAPPESSDPPPVAPESSPAAPEARPDPGLESLGLGTASFSTFPGTDALSAADAAERAALVPTPEPPGAGDDAAVIDEDGGEVAAAGASGPGSSAGSEPPAGAQPPAGGWAASASYSRYVFLQPPDAPHWLPPIPSRATRPAPKLIANGLVPVPMPALPHAAPPIGRDGAPGVPGLRQWPRPADIRTVAPRNPVHEDEWDAWGRPRYAFQPGRQRGRYRRARSPAPDASRDAGAFEACRIDVAIVGPAGGAGSAAHASRAALSSRGPTPPPLRLTARIRFPDGSGLPLGNQVFWSELESAPETHRAELYRLIPPAMTEDPRDSHMGLAPGPSASLSAASLRYLREYQQRRRTRPLPPPPGLSPRGRRGGSAVDMGASVDSGPRQPRTAPPAASSLPVHRLKVKGSDAGFYSSAPALAVGAEGEGSGSGFGYASSAAGAGGAMAALDGGAFERARVLGVPDSAVDRTSWAFTEQHKLMRGQAAALPPQLRGLAR